MNDPSGGTKQKIKTLLRMAVAVSLIIAGVTVVYTIGTTIYASLFDTQYSFKEKILQCSREPDQIACYKLLVSGRIAEKDTQGVLRELDALQHENTRVAPLCHNVAHAIGHVTYQTAGTVAAAFSVCNQTCHAGCYHGAVEAFLQESMGTTSERHVNEDDLKNRITSVCKSFSSPNTCFQCHHGLGHAIMYLLDYNLPESLSWCEVLQNTKNTSACIGGALMENINGSMKEKRMLNDDPHYPCSILEEKYKDDCYAMQTTRMGELGLSNSEIEAQCASVENGRNSCFLSLGRDKSVDIRLGKGREISKLCENLPLPEDTNACIQGAAFALADHTWDGSYAFPFCALLEKEKNRTMCFHDSAAHLIESRDASKNTLTENCAAVTKYQNECIQAVNETEVGDTETLSCF